MGIVNKETGLKDGKESRSVLRERIIGFLETRFDDVEELWESLETKEKIQLYKDLLKYAVPSPSNAEHKVENCEADDLQLLISRLGHEECTSGDRVDQSSKDGCPTGESEINLSINQ